MDRRERINDPVEGILAALTGFQASLWTALPCVIKSFNASKMTVEAKPAMQAQLRDSNGNLSFVDLPLLVDCPVVFPGGGGFTLTFPVAAGDECLMVLASRCIDGWWQSGMQGNAAPQPPDLRMHDLSDGFALVGVRSLPRVLDALSTSNVQLRSDDGQAFVQIAPNHDVSVQTTGGASVVAGSAIALVAPTINITGNVVIAGGTLTHNGVNVGSTHHHGNVQNGGGITSGPA